MKLTPDKDMKLKPQLRLETERDQECKLNSTNFLDEKTYLRTAVFVCSLQDDLSNLSEEKDFGDVTVSLHNEDILPEYTIRTMKVSNIVAQSYTECIRY